MILAGHAFDLRQMFKYLAPVRRLGCEAHLDDVLAYARQRAGNLGNRGDLVAPVRVWLAKDFFSRRSPDRDE